MTIGIALGGGGSKGIWQAGALKALRDSGIKYDVVLGVSVGALNALKVGQRDWEGLEKIWLNLKNDQVYTNRLFDILTSNFIYDTDPLHKLLEEQVKIPLLDQFVYANVTGYEDNCSSTINLNNSEDMVSLLRASSAVPVLFPPVSYKGNLYVDGGVTDNFGIYRLATYGCDTIISFNFGPPAPKVGIRNIIQSFSDMMEASFHSQYLFQMQAIQSINEAIVKDKSSVLLEAFIGISGKTITVHEIRPDKPLDLNIIDFNYKEKREDIMQEGYDTAAKVLKCVS